MRDKLNNIFVLFTSALLILNGCKKESDFSRFSEWMDFSIPDSASNLYLEEAGFPMRFINNSFYAQFHLTPADIKEFLSAAPAGYSAWEPLVEVYSNKHFFTRSHYPDALQTSCLMGEGKQYIIAEPKTGIVHALAWRD